VKHRTTQSALLVAGAAAGVAALAWVGKRRYLAAAPPSTAIDQDAQPNQDDEQTAVRRRPQPSQLDRGSDDYLALIEDDLLEADRRELPLGRSADPAIDDELRPSGGGDETSGAALFSEPEPDRPISDDISLDQIWDAPPRSEADALAEGYDAVTPEDLGSVWLERATQTTHEERYMSDPSDPATLDELMISEATRASARPLDAEEVEKKDAEQSARGDENGENGEDDDPNEVQEDDLDIDEKP
jgi:hypothetical protein